MRLVFLLALFLASFAATPAANPGTAKGSLQVGAETIPLKFAAAQMHDNAEKLLDRPRELRIVLADREIPQDALSGIVSLPVAHMAREGKVKGLLLRVDPGNRRRVSVTLLRPVPTAQVSLLNQTLTAGQDAFRTLEVKGNRLIGEIEYRDTSSRPSDYPKVGYTVRFSAPLFNEPAVTADLKGKEAHDSPQVRLLRERARALAKGDFAFIRKFSTERTNRATDVFLERAGSQAPVQAREAAADLERSLKKLQRVVVRGDRAVVIFPGNEWMNFAHVKGQWLLDD